MNRCIFNFYGFLIEVQSNDSLIVDHLRRDFAFFARETTAPATLILEAVFAPPDFESMPDCEASYISPRNIVYKYDGKSYYDYFGKALLVEEASRTVATSSDTDLLREVFYLYILSKVGLYLDGKGLHRLHAAALSYRGRAVLLLCPSGGGKSTTTFNLLSRDGYGMLSEDSPLVGAGGDIHPFCLCLGCKGEPPEDIPRQYLRTVSRMEFDPKTLIDLEYFQSRLETEPMAPGPILIGVRHSGKTSEIVPVSRGFLLRILFRDLVVGMGIFQGVEFLFRNKLSGLARHALVMASRLRGALALTRRGTPYLFRMGRDIEKNTETVHRFLTQAPS